MTLITYYSRVHFSDGVAEEAIFAEMEGNGIARPVLISDASQRDGDVMQRLAVSLPRGTGNLGYTLPPDTDPGKEALAIAELYLTAGADAIIAVGSARSLEIGRKARRRIQTAQGNRLPPLIVMPGVDGLPDPCRVLASDMGRHPFLNGQKSPPPTAIVLDPTMTHGADLRLTLAGAATALTRCIEAYLSPSFHPPADGIALHGLRLLSSALPELVGGDTAQVRRSLMAAAFDGALAQQKASGPTQALTLALRAVGDPGILAGELRAVLLPHVLASASVSSQQLADLRQALCLDPTVTLAEGVAALCGGAGLPRKLAPIGITESSLDAAARRATEMVDLWETSEAPLTRALNLLHAAF
jgi:alcohol dehydrogenase class IV